MSRPPDYQMADTRLADFRSSETTHSSGINPGPIVLGIALSGFFDGILLHQVLQWHHLLSLVEGAPFNDLRVQVFADGIFHVLMYLLALAGIIMLWREDRSDERRSNRRTFCASLLLGFGAWNIADVGLFHWVLGIHHIRVDTEWYLAWDVLWLVVLGLLPTAAGWWMRKPPANGNSGKGRSSLFQAAVTIGVLLAGTLSMRVPASDMTTVLFRPDMKAGEVMAVVSELGGSWVAADQSGTLAVIKLPPGVNPWRLYRHGALLVGAAGPGGCLSWTRV